MTHILYMASSTTALLVLSIFTLRLWRNLRFLRRARRLTQLPMNKPRVSVLVPARNEARTIAACIKSLACQDYPDFEVIALDDQSDDETGVLLDELAARYPNVTVLHGTENPPVGWNGKSYACQRLAEHASGDWLLFTDADTLHTLSSITQGMAQAMGLNVDLLSVFPRQVTQSWSERLMVSYILDFLPLIAIDLIALWRGNSSITAGNGQYVLARAATYHMLGGHRSIAQALVDDFALAKLLRANGKQVALVDGTFMLSCRMYRNVREVWLGFSKNILLALETSALEKGHWWWRPLFAWGYACVFVIPFFNLLFAGQKLLSLIAIIWLLVLRGIVTGRLRRSTDEVITTPLAAWGVMALGLSALLQRRQGKNVTWKGRDYAATS